jgi:hypothetical protein
MAGVGARIAGAWSQRVVVGVGGALVAVARSPAAADGCRGGARRRCLVAVRCIAL